MNAYGIFDVLIEVGGLWFILQIMFSNIIHPISKHRFLINVIEKFYIVRTRDYKLFDRKTTDRWRNRYLDLWKIA